MPQQQPDHGKPQRKRKPSKGSIVLFIFGLAVTLQGGFGAAFVGGDPSASMSEVVGLLLLACLGVTLLVFGALGYPRG